MQHLVDSSHGGSRSIKESCMRLDGPKAMLTLTSIASRPEKMTSLDLTKGLLVQEG